MLRHFTRRTCNPPPRSALRTPQFWPLFLVPSPGQECTDSPSHSAHWNLHQKLRGGHGKKHSSLPLVPLADFSWVLIWLLLSGKPREEADCWSTEGLSIRRHLRIHFPVDALSLFLFYSSYFFFFFFLPSISSISPKSTDLRSKMCDNKFTILTMVCFTKRNVVSPLTGDGWRERQWTSGKKDIALGIQRPLCPRSMTSDKSTSKSVLLVPHL